MKRVYIIFTLILFAASAYSQENMTLTQCYELARANYPLIRKHALIEKTEQYNLSNAGKAWLPQVSLNAKATYQSEVTKLPIDFSSIPGMPNISIPSLSKDQYQMVAEVSQTVWDGGLTHSARQFAKAEANANHEQVESDLYSLNERVNQLYFGCLLHDELLQQNAILQKELQVNIDRVKALETNGLANESDRQSLEVEVLNGRQREIELKASRSAYSQMLNVLIGKPANETLSLTTPILPGSTLSTNINRPELRALDAQSNLMEVQNKQITAGLMPRIGLFMQGGYGKPGLNMLENKFSTFYIGGVRLSWNLGKLYSLKNDRRKVETGRQMVEIQRDAFLFNTGLQVMQQNTEIQKMSDLLKADDEIVRLRTNIKKAAEVKLENGVISVTDLIREINAEDMAKQTVATHKIQQLMSIYNLMYTTNNK